MALVSVGFGHALARGAAGRRLDALTPALGCVALLFGAWYTLGAAGTVPYVL
jgi:hypothetical protein